MVVEDSTLEGELLCVVVSRGTIDSLMGAPD
jgi:hypothetical protein